MSNTNTQDYTGKIGFRFRQIQNRPPVELAQALLDYSSCNLSDGLNKFYSMDHGIHAMFPCRMAGIALTVKVRSADNLMLHKAIELIQPGDVLVVDTQSCADYSVCGELMVSCMQKKGAAGIVVDGSVRDIEDLRQIGMPVFARGTSASVGDKAGPGEVNFPVVCGKVVVQPGDFVMGDENSVVVIPRADYDAVLAGARIKTAGEERRRLEIAEGILVRPDVDDILRKVGII